MSHPNRRTFMMTLAAGSGALAAAQASAQDAETVVREASPLAVALGYKADATQLDKTKFRQRTPDQVCGACTFYRGKPAEAMGRCKLLEGKQVSAQGWCSAWAQKAIKE